jgi:endonuclease YncB( thermonuclease family)
MPTIILTSGGVASNTLIRSPARDVARITRPIAPTLLLVLALSFATPAAAQTLSGPAKVADGDTLEIQTPNGPARVRLWGVDAPELAQSCTRKNGQEWACGVASKDALKAALGDLKAVTCVTKQVDQYGRNVASCAGPSGVDVGSTLVEEGLAVEYRQFSKGTYTAAERDAKKAKAGMWDGSFQQPAEWRKEKRAKELSGGVAPRAISTPVTGALGGGGVVSAPGGGAAAPAAAPAAKAAPATPAAAAAAAPAPAPAAPGKADPHPAGCDIKGNISQRGRKVFHSPDSPAYASVKVDTAAGEKWFCSEAEAEKAGWKKAQPGGRPAREAED